MKRLLAHLATHPGPALLASVVTLALGVYAALHLGVDLFPSLDVPVVNVVAHDPGTSPTDMERLVTRPIEETLEGATGIQRVASTTLPGISIVTAQLAWGTTAEQARQVVTSRLAQARSLLPAGVTALPEEIGTTLQQVGGWALAGAGDPVALGELARHELRSRLLGVPGVSAVEVDGGERPALWVETPPERLAAAGLTVGDLVGALRRADGVETAGIFERASEDVTVRAGFRLLDPAAISAVPLRSTDGRPLLVGQIAAVHRGRAPRRDAVRLDGVPAVVLFVRKQPGADAIAVVRGVDRELAGLRHLLPPGLRVVKVYDQSELLLAARRGIAVELVSGAVLAVAVLWFLLGSLRPTGAVALTIPLALLATLAVLWFVGQSLNVITMAALTLSVGMIVDDAIVVTENVHRRREDGLSPAEAAVEGALEIAGPDASGTLTTVAAFLPLLLVGGLAGVFLRPFGLTLSTALLASLVLSLGLVPFLLARGDGAAHRGGPAAGDRLGPLPRWLDTLREGALAHRRSSLLAALVLLVAAAAALAVFPGPVGLLPPVDEGALLVEYVLPPGVSLAESERTASRIAAAALRLPGVAAVEQRVGSEPGTLQVEGPNRGELLIKLVPPGSGRPSADAVTAHLRRATASLEGVALLFHQPTQEKMDESFSGLPALFGVTVYGPDPTTLGRLASRVAALLRADPATSGVVDDASLGRPQMDARVDGARCAALGVDPADVRATVAAAVRGQEALRVLRQGHEVPIFVRLTGTRGVGDLAALPVPAPGGGLVPLARLADLDLHRVPAKIERLDGQREVTLLASVSGNLPAVAHRLAGRLERLELPAGYSAAVTGQYPVLLKTARDLLFVLAAAGVVMLLILTLQLRSLARAAWVLAVVPVSLAGAALGLAVTGVGIDVAAGAGLLTLVGIAVNNGIVLVDFADRRLAQGVEPRAALREAARVRLRPIVATTATTVAGLLPAALALGSGQHLFQPFAVAVVSGLALGTLATLVLLPAAVLPGLDRWWQRRAAPLPPET